MDAMKHLILISLFIVSISGCSNYKPTIQQGNALDSTTVSQIKVGMSKSDVIQALGSPLLTDDFNQSRWDYLYYVTERGQRSEQKNLTLQFDGNVITKIN
ncbi:outer membrane protein assembly factor BamE [Leucothrix arctica]|uniref:Outer membrane protein assembly factor BamE n=2 Tax=Leucothrix arctica TaxID=1481894 RepID=A0A317CK11_9GAMM|nr:outer membrane protein assembly factor BamE [Leucothrix arctica]